jgi:signal transduction histidine kinase
MRSIGARLALWYATAATVTMLCLFLAGRYFLEQYVIHSLDLLNQDEFTQIRSELGPGYAELTSDQIKEKLRPIAAYQSILFYIEIQQKGKGTVFRSPNLGGQSMPDVKGKHIFDGTIPGFAYALEVGEFVSGPMDILIGTSKEQVKTVMKGDEHVFYGSLGAMLLISAVLGYILSHYALRPLRTIQETANHISSDNLSERIPVSSVHDEISDLARLLNQTFDRLESSFNQIRRFTAEASHELKTPLSLIRLQAEKLLVEGGLPPGQEESVQVQLEEIARLNQIIEELLFLSRAEASAITLARKTEDPARFLHTFAQDGRVLSESRNVSFVEQLEGVGSVSFDPRWIRQVLLNLLSNALNVSPAGSSIRLTSKLNEGTWQVALEDEGPGVPDEQRERIFERFVRLESSNAEQFQKGSGLGLAISRSIIVLHKGVIRAEAKAQGTGLRVVFELPRT